MSDFKELNLDSLDKVSGGEKLPESVDLLDPSQEHWRSAIRSNAQARKSFEGTSLEQTIIAIRNSYLELGMELIHLTEFLTPIWDTLPVLTPKSFS